MDQMQHEDLFRLSSHTKNMLFISCVSEVISAQMEGDIAGLIIATQRMRELRRMFGYSPKEVIKVENFIQAYILQERATPLEERRWKRRKSRRRH